MDINGSGTEATGLIDITHVPLSELSTLDDSTALGRSLRRVVAAADKQEQEATSAFNSAV